jgi:hypothetical protein
LPRRGEENRLSPPEQIATAAATGMRTANAVAIDEDALIDVENAMMKLSDVIAATYFTTHARSDAPWDALG